MIEAASEQMTELLELVGLLARIEAGRWEPQLAEADSLELAHSAAGEKIRVTGEGGPVTVDAEAAVVALRGLTDAALRHGGLEELSVQVTGTDLTLSPVGEAVRPIVLGEELRDLGAAAGRRIVEALGGSVAVDGDAVVVSLPG